MLKLFWYFSFGDILDDELPAKNTGPKEGDQV